MSTIKFFRAVKTLDGKTQIPRGTYGVTVMIVQENNKEREMFFLNNMDGICLAKMSLKIMESLGTAKFIN